MHMKTRIDELSVGSIGIIVGYDSTYGGYVGKLMAMGLTPETEFVVLEICSTQGCVSILLQDRILNLSKPEVNALCVEENCDR